MVPLALSTKTVLRPKFVFYQFVRCKLHAMKFGTQIITTDLWATLSVVSVGWLWAKKNNYIFVDYYWLRPHTSRAFLSESWHLYMVPKSQKMPQRCRLVLIIVRQDEPSVAIQKFPVRGCCHTVGVVHAIRRKQNFAGWLVCVTWLVHTSSWCRLQ